MSDVDIMGFDVSIDELMVLAELFDAEGFPLVDPAAYEALVGRARSHVMDAAARSLLARHVVEVTTADGDLVIASPYAAALTAAMSSPRSILVEVEEPGGQPARRALHSLHEAVVSQEVLGGVIHRFCLMAGSSLEDLLERCLPEAPLLDGGTTDQTPAVKVSVRDLRTLENGGPAGSLPAWASLLGEAAHRVRVQDVRRAPTKIDADVTTWAEAPSGAAVLVEPDPADPASFLLQLTSARKVRERVLEGVGGERRSISRTA